MVNSTLNLISTADVKGLVNTRKGEVKIGERVRLARKGDFGDLQSFVNKGCRFAVIGIPESIGVRGNHGDRGTETAWRSFIKAFLNVQSNRFLDGSEFLLLGEVNVEELMSKAEDLNANTSYYLQKLHVLCEELDELVWPLISHITESGLIPIVIGGGHNNAFPILKGVAKGLKRKRGVNAINMDAHADFRSLEGRHSGNGFSYAKQAGFLNKYVAFGLHQSYNGENMLKSMDATRNVSYQFLEEITFLDKSLADAVDYVFDEHVPCGIEIDLDAIRLMPSSAFSPSGFSLEQARHFIRKCTKGLKPAYLHLPEAAPVTDREEVLVGKALTYLVTDFVKAFLSKQ